MLQLQLCCILNCLCCLYTPSLIENGKRFCRCKSLSVCYLGCFKLRDIDGCPPPSRACWNNAYVKVLNCFLSIQFSLSKIPPTLFFSPYHPSLYVQCSELDCGISSVFFCVESLCVFSVCCPKTFWSFYAQPPLAALHKKADNTKVIRVPLPLHSTAQISP